MFFCTYEHYDDTQPNYYDNNNNDNNNEVSECFICFDIKISNETTPIKLKKQTIYFKTCSCDCFVHNICLQQWFEKNNTCPICRIIVRKKNTIFFIVNDYILNRIYTYIYIINLFKTFIKMISSLFMFCLFIEYYFTHYLFFHKNFYLFYKLDNYNHTLSN
jgi:hypothetical protein